MKKLKAPSSLTIILMGELMVNLPVIIIMLLSIFLFLYIGVMWQLSFLFAAGIGWYAWEKLLIVWKNWALKRNVERERLFNLGKIGFINFYRSRIIDDTSAKSEKSEAK